MAIANGVYRIVSRLNTSQCIDINSASLSNGANAQLYANNDTNAQKMYVGADADGYTDLRFLHSRKMLDVSGGIAALSQNVQQYEYNNTRAQDWQVVDSGTDAAINGVAVTAYYIKSKIKNNYVLDASWGQNKNGTNLQLYTLNNSDAQKWLLQKDSYRNDKLAVPASLGWGFAANTTPSVSRCVTTTQTLFPIFKCSGSNYQLRTRWRGRKTGTGEWGGWSFWQNLAGSAADEGWGDAWLKNCTAESVGGYKKTTAGISVSVDQATYDRKQYQIEVRQIGTISNWLDGGYSIPQHGPSATATVNAIYWPTNTINEVTFTPDGLMIGYSSDFKRGGNTLEIGKIKTPEGQLTLRPITFKHLEQSGTVTIPFSELAFIPSVNLTASFSAKLTTIDCSRTQNFSKPVTYSANHGLALNVTQTPYAGEAILVKLAGSFVAGECHISYFQDGKLRLSECEAIEGGFLATPPFKKEYTLFAKASDSSNSWGTKSLAGKAVDGKSFVLNFGDDFFRLRLTGEAYATPVRSQTREHETYMLMGNDYESVYFGSGSATDISITGLVLDGDDEHGNTEAFGRAEMAEYAILRNPYGDRYDVAVVSSSKEPRARGVHDISLSLKVRS